MLDIIIILISLQRIISLFACLSLIELSLAVHSVTGNDMLCSVVNCYCNSTFLARVLPFARDPNIFTGFQYRVT